MIIDDYYFQIFTRHSFRPPMGKKLTPMQQYWLDAIEEHGTVKAASEVLRVNYAVVKNHAREIVSKGWTLPQV